MFHIFRCRKGNFRANDGIVKRTDPLTRKKKNAFMAMANVSASIHSMSHWDFSSFFFCYYLFQLSRMKEVFHQWELPQYAACSHFLFSRKATVRIACKIRRFTNRRKVQNVNRHVMGKKWMRSIFIHSEKYHFNAHHSIENEKCTQVPIQLTAKWIGDGA